VPLARDACDELVLVLADDARVSSRAEDLAITELAWRTLPAPLPEVGMLNAESKLAVGFSGYVT
jgi:hypothetical protein